MATYGGKIALRSHRNKLVCVEPSHSIMNNRDNCGDWEKFTITSASGKPYGSPVCVNDRVRLQTHHGKYLCCEPNGQVFANRDHPGDWETFEVLDANSPNYYSSPQTVRDNHMIALKTHHQTYLNDSEGALHGDARSLNQWEKFTFISASPQQPYHSQTGYPAPQYQQYQNQQGYPPQQYQTQQGYPPQQYQQYPNQNAPYNPQYTSSPQQYQQQYPNPNAPYNPQYPNQPY
ncbi:hypothetical protein AKO1_008104 [Acrasis kona]|uniref:Uncharacterized protein n=1 Tax=Acrasis kona TaxID=1008807 RepID=A0AAW2YR48_9EUKA